MSVETKSSGKGGPSVFADAEDFAEILETAGDDYAGVNKKQVNFPNFFRLFGK